MHGSRSGAYSPAGNREIPPISGPTFTEYLHAREAGHEPSPRITKTFGRDLATRLGIRVARQLALVDAPEDLPLASLPDRFVIKPTCFWSRLGVLLLQREPGTDRYRDALSRRVLTSAEIIAEEVGWRERWLSQPRRERFGLLVEEWLDDECGSPIPLDYKLFAFDGEIRFITQFDRNQDGRRLAFFLNEFEPIDDLGRVLTSDWSAIAQHTAKLPTCHRDLVDAAKRLSVAMNTPFIRVDLYATPTGPALGELTAIPGTPRNRFQFAPSIDAALGQAWRAAAARIAGRG